MQDLVQKISKKESKTDWNSEAGLAPKSARRHFWSAARHFSSAEWHKIGPRLEGIWIKLKHILFDFLEIRTHPSLYSDHLAIFSSLPTSINRCWISKFRTGSKISPFSDSFLFPLTLKTFWGSCLRNFFIVSKIF